MRVSLTVFTHLLDANERIRGQMDSIPLPGEALTTSWLPGEALGDEFELFVDPDAPVGTYAMEIGMYAPAQGIVSQLLWTGFGWTVIVF